MKEFRFIVKVDHSNPIKTLQKLGELVCEDQKAFDSVDVDFVQKQDFVVAVPVELALTTEMRAHVLYNIPKCRFVVTGVPTHRLTNLLEFGFRVYGANFEGSEKKDERKENVAKVENDPGEPEVPVEKKKEEVPAEIKNEKIFWVNGKEVSEEEFNEKVKEFKNDIENSPLPSFLFW